MEQVQLTLRPKRLVVLSDGTWQTPENVTPTNILKLARAIKPISEATMQHQIVFYDGKRSVTLSRSCPLFQMIRSGEDLMG
mmetsp:Transcript_2141/g.3723  ORF Transcript_2141/g.3723 Transcript_2141/m.3723 type:complete len:81 (+) Transcript_2141:329-571(+)